MSQPQSYQVIVTRITTILLLIASSVCAAETARAMDKEAELLAVLKSDASPAEKALACKNLAIYGSEAAVVELAKLLPDEQLSSWARIALEAIPGSAANAALRDAADKLQGKLLIGMINSLGVRRDAEALPVLKKRLQDVDHEVASAAAIALGKVGGQQAAALLVAALPVATEPHVRSAIAQGCVLCAERMLADGQHAESAILYDLVRGADMPMQRRVEATRGAILARQQKGIPLLIETLHSPERKLFQIGLATARELSGNDVDQALADQLDKLPSERAALLITAMADRPDSAPMAAIMKAAQTDDKTLRLAAVDALRRVGNETCLPVLMQTALDSDTDVATLARQSLAELSGDGVDVQIVKLLAAADDQSSPVLLELVGRRRIEAVAEVLPWLENENSAIRHAALKALGETVTLQRLSLLIEQAVSPKQPEDATAAQQALKVASVRMPDREACAEQLSQAIDRSSVAAKVTLLEILSEVGGVLALKTLDKAARNSDDALQDAASRLLGKWNNVDAAPVLLDLAKTAPADKYRVRALRGYLGLARKFAMPEADRVQMCRSAIDATGRVAEHKLALEVLKLHPSPEGLQLVVMLSKTPELKSDASAAALAIAQKMGGDSVNANELIRAIGLDTIKLEILKAEYGAGAAMKDVTEVVKKQASNVPLIALNAGDYNSSFGGDPAPGVVKQLKIQYRINNKAGEATFAENAMILLPMP
ncbi:MAG: HEAT repeat domain-containing protein [Planctomycetaceae bacterium]|nr:HEAT repeat domain-containing protein [Planctomycetaceae bacterium]